MLEEYILNTIERLIHDQEKENIVPICIFHKHLMTEVREDVNNVLNKLYLAGKIDVHPNFNKEKLISLPHDTTG